jgi:tetratricopeptide (TPR) repeat protein
MRIINRVAAVAVGLLVTATLAHAQSINLPPDGDNEAASVSQGIGPVKVTIDYHSPKVIRGTNDRRGKIWGALVPYGMQPGLGYGNCTQCPWRGGANENTTFTVSHDVKVEGQPLKAGTYGLHFIPDPNEWTVIFSNNSTSWGSFFYNPAEDALRVKVKASKSDYHEYLAYEFTDRQPAQATVALKWEELQVPFTIVVEDPAAIYLAAIRRDLQGSKGFDRRNFMAAALYAVRQKEALPDALKWAQTAVSGQFVGKESFDTLTTLAEAQEANGLAAEAAKTHEKAFNDPSATANDLHQYARGLQAAGKNDDAIKVFELNAKRHPNVWPVNVGLARASMMKGKKDDALKYAKLAMPQAPDDPSRKNLEALIKLLEEGKQ